MSVGLVIGSNVFFPGKRWTVGMMSKKRYVEWK